MKDTSDEGGRGSGSGRGGGRSRRRRRRGRDRRARRRIPTGRGGRGRRRRNRRERRRRRAGRPDDTSRRAPAPRPGPAAPWRWASSSGSPRGRLTPEKRLAHERRRSPRKARQLVIRVILPGEWYLVRWGGTRKGSGTFYTRPGLAVPTVQRTLRPLAYTPPLGPDGTPDLGAPAASWTPKTPEEILALKVCDPACGSGTFPVAALRFLTDALFASLHHHGRIREDGDRAVVAPARRDADGDEPERLGEELLPCRPTDDTFEPRLKADPAPPRRRALHLRRRPRPARGRALPPLALDRDDGPDAAVLVPRPQGQVRQQPRRRLVRPVPALPGDGLEEPRGRRQEARPTASTSRRKRGRRRSRLSSRTC